MDEERRPLNEGKVPLAQRPPEIAFELRACPYRGSRSGRPINVSALRQTTAHFPLVLETLGAIRSMYVAERGAAALDFDDLWRLAVALTVLPSFLMVRERNPVSEAALPAFVAVSYKVGAGLVAAARELSSMQRLEVEQRLPPFTATGIVDFVEQTGLLVGPHEACAAPAGMIAEVVAVLIAPGSEAASAAGVTRLAALLGDPADYLQFAAWSVRVKNAVVAYGSLLRTIEHDLRAPLGQADDDPRRLFDAAPTAWSMDLGFGMFEGVASALGELPPPDRGSLLREIIAPSDSPVRDGGVYASAFERLCAACAAPSPEAVGPITDAVRARVRPAPDSALRVVATSVLALVELERRLGETLEVCVAGLRAALGYPPAPRADGARHVRDAVGGSTRAFLAARLGFHSTDDPMVFATDIGALRVESALAPAQGR